tara:strand:+ start:902 stop:1648 length:747 start_codon:yes stop_codon:yes gene_type:complete
MNIRKKILRRLLKYYYKFFQQKNYRLTIKNLIILKILNFEKAIFSSYLNEHNNLNNLSKKYKSDKHTHNYLELLEFYFHNQRESVEKILECGIGSSDSKIQWNMMGNSIPGASLRMWKDYFYNADIYGVDIDEKILFDENRIFTFQVDQTNSDSIEKFINNFKLKNNTFDLIIDDGAHWFPPNFSFFINTIKLLKDTGLYVVEDVNENTYYQFMKYFHDKEKDYFVMSSAFLNPSSLSNSRLLLIQKK